MKRIIAVFCLLALILAGCAQKEAPEKQVETTQDTQTTETAEVPEQIVGQDVSPLTGSWETTLDRGQQMATLYYLQTGGDQEYAAVWLGFMEKVTFPLRVTVELNHDGSYTYTVHADTEGKALEAFAESLYNGLVAYYMDLNKLTETQAKDYMADNGFAFWDVNANIQAFQMDKMYAQPAITTGTWEHNDQGLFLSGWCTVQFEENDGTMTWTGADELELEELLPLTFTKN